MSKRTALRAGYGAVIGLLVISSFEAYRIQQAVSEKHIGIYRQYVQRDAVLSQLRRTIWFAGNYVRDFFINTNPTGAALLKSQLRELKAESQQALDQLDRLGGVRHPELRPRLQELWEVLDPIPQSMLHKSNAEQYNFVQQEIVPRRSVLYTALRELTEADLAALQRSDADFAETQRAAGRRLVLTLGLCVILGLLVSACSLIYSENLERETKRQYEEVAQAKREQEQLSARLLEMEEDGRKRLSRELHDEIGQALAILQIEISNALAASDAQVRVMKERLRRARDLAEKTVQSVRNIALLLRPALLDDLGLVPALQWQLDDFIRRTGLACEFSEEGVEDLLPDSVKTCVYRVVQEALHNCEKHAGASEVGIRLRQIPQLLSVEIQDNGCGFALNAKGMPHHGAGLGILGMRERAAKVGGSLALESAPGRGTRVSLAIPLAVTAGAAREPSRLAPART